MKKLVNCFLLITGMLIGLTSCNDHTIALDSTSHIGNWTVVSMMGQSDLSDITGIDIDENTITMQFKECSEHGSLFREYGASNTVNYTYSEDDIDFHGNHGVSLTFDKPLYFEEYDNSYNYITKVFIQMKDRHNGVDGVFLTWTGSARSHVLTLTK